MSRRGSGGWCRRGLALFVFVTGGWSLGGCLLPVPRTALVRPAALVRVEDEHGSPLAGAEVVLIRWNVGPPPQQMTHAWLARTDARGEARFERLRETEWILPLMPHGVPFWAWTVCAAAEGHGMGHTRWYAGRMPPQDDEHEDTVWSAVLRLEPSAAGGSTARPLGDRERIERCWRRDREASDELPPGGAAAGADPASAAGR